MDFIVLLQRCCTEGGQTLLTSPSADFFGSGCTSRTVLGIEPQNRLEATTEDHLVQPFVGKGA